jgi:hypothetical protein
MTSSNFSDGPLGRFPPTTVEILVFSMAANTAWLTRRKGNESRWKELTADYEAWAQAVGVVDWSILKPKLLNAWQISDTQG